MNTLVTCSVAAWLLVSRSRSPRAGEIFQGKRVILLCPQGWALSGHRRSRSVGRLRGRFLCGPWKHSGMLSAANRFPHPLFSNLPMLSHFGVLRSFFPFPFLAPHFHPSLYLLTTAASSMFQQRNRPRLCAEAVSEPGTRLL